MEYVTFEVTAADGTVVEMAVIDEFEFERKNYVAAARVVDDTIDEDGVYIYAVKLSGEAFSVEKITDPKIYESVVKAYMEL